MLRKLVSAIVIVGGLLFVIATGARFYDGPIGPFPGGPMHGSLTRGAEPRWSAILADEDSIEMQVDPADPRSLHVWFVLLNGAVHVPSAWASHKKWPAEVEADPRVVVRVKGRLYERHATRVTDPAIVDTLLGLVDEKYGSGRGDPETTWFFRLDPPQP